MESKVLGDDFGMRFFMCENYEYNPPKRHNKDRPKVLHETLWFPLMDLTLTSNLGWDKDSIASM
jgi:hypothetical protein